MIVAPYAPKGNVGGFNMRNKLFIITLFMVLALLALEQNKVCSVTLKAGGVKVSAMLNYELSK